MSESLGRATLELTANLAPFETNMKAANRTADSMQHALDSLAAVSKIAEDALQRVKMKPGQGAESASVEDKIKGSVGRVGRAALDAADHLGKVKLDSKNAAETVASGDIIDRKLKNITGNANEARRSLESVRVASAGNPGAGVGPFGSGFGRIGVLGAAIGGGALLGPAAGPGALGLLAAIPALAGTAGGAMGTLVLAFQGLGKAIGGDKKAFDALLPVQQTFVQMVRSLKGELDKLKTVAASTMFPGLTAGLKSALSPGTLGAVSTAVGEFGRAIGQAGATWGRYFGSAEFQSLFGPLMAAGARNFSTMSDTALRLFDALGVLGRAAIPLTEWMVKGVDAGARWADSFLLAKSASGGLASALDEAKTSLRLVGLLFASLGKAVYELGAALYPVSKIAVKDLTDGFNALAGIIKHNQDGIREFVGGALDALVSTVKGAAPIVTTLAHGLKAVVDAIGGWKTAFEIVIGGFLAVKFLALGRAVAAAFAVIVDTNPILLALSGIALVAELVITHWKTVRTWFVEFGDWLRIWADNQALGVVEPFSHLPGILGGWARTAKDAILQNLSDAKAHLAYERAGAASGNAYGAAFAAAASSATYLQVGDKAPAGYKPGSYGSQPSTRVNPGGFTPGKSQIPNASYTQQEVYKLLLANGVPRDVATNLSIISAKGEDPSGSPYALNNNPKTGDYSVGLFQENFLGKMGVGRVKQYAPQFGKSPTTPVDQFVSWLGKHPAAQAQIAYQIYQSQGYGAWTTAAGLGITGGGTTTSPYGALPPWPKNVPAVPSLPAWKGATQATITTALGAVAATLKGIPTTLDPVEKNAVSHIKALNTALRIHMSAADLAKDQVALRKWGKVLSTEITKNATAATAAAKKHAAALKQALAETTTISDYRQTLSNFGAALRTTLDQTLGIPQTYATPKALAAAEAGAEKINKRIAAGFYKNATTLKAATDQRDLLLQTIEDGLTGLEAAVEKAKVPYESAWAKLAGAADAAFGTNTQRHLAVMQAALSKFQSSMAQLNSSAGGAFAKNTQTRLAEMAASAAQSLKDMQITVAGFGFLFGGSITKTPAEQALADLQAGQQNDQLQQSLTDAQQAVTDARNASLVYDSTTGLTTVNVNNVALIAAQKQLAAAQLAITESSLQTQATAERTAADAQLATAQTAYQARADAEQTAYTDQRAIQGSALDDQVAAIVAAMTDGTTSTSDGLTAISKLWTDAGIDISTTAGEIGGTIYASLGDAIKSMVGSIDGSTTAAQTAYTDQRTLLQAAMDDQADIIKGAFEAGQITAATAFDELKKLYGDNGIDLASLSVDIAGTIYNGVAAWTAPIMQLMDDLMAKIAATQQALGLPVTAVVTSSPMLGAAPGMGARGGTFIPMAAGGMGRVTIPTLFLAGEAGPEDVAFSGAGKSFGRANNSGGQPTVIVNFNGWTGNEAEAGMQVAKSIQKLNMRGYTFGFA